MDKSHKTEKQISTELTDPLTIQVATGLLIRKLRCELGMSGAELGQAVQISQQQISRYERGVCDLTLSQAEVFANAFGLSLWQFIDKLFFILYTSDTGEKLPTPFTSGGLAEIVKKLDMI